MKIVRELEKGYTITQTEIEGWFYFWIKDPHGEDVETFASVQRALKWWEMNKATILDGSETPEYRIAKREAKKMVRKMGGNFDLMSKEEQDEWIKECSGEA